MEIIEHKCFRNYSRESQKLIYWLIGDYSNFKTGSPVGTNPTDYYISQAKKELKKLYLKSLGMSRSNIYPFRDFRNNLKEKVDDILQKNVSNTSKTEIILNDVEVLIRDEFKNLMIKLDETFSLQLNMMSQEEANNFITWLFDFFLDKNIPMREEIAQLYAEQQNDKYIYSLLKNKKCAICGEKADLHHFDQASGISGYKYDNGLKTRFMPLCRNHHTEFHNIGMKEFVNKYHITGIWLDETKVKELKKIYPNHFRAFKEK